eukprot:SAG11_NODE_617_length_8185_cov_6.989859_1_plen_53_part_00
MVVDAAEELQEDTKTAGKVKIGRIDGTRIMCGFCKVRSIVRRLFFHPTIAPS